MSYLSLDIHQMATVKTGTTLNAGEDAEKLHYSYVAGGDKDTLEKSLWFLKNKQTNMYLS